MERQFICSLVLKKKRTLVDKQIVDYDPLGAMCSIIARRRRYRRLLLFSTSDFLLGDAVDKIKKTRRDTQGGCISNLHFFPLSVFFSTFYRFCPCSLAHSSSPGKSLSLFSFRSRHFASKRHIIIEILFLFGTRRPVVNSYQQGVYFPKAEENVR